MICFFSSRRRHTRCLSDWSSDVCSSDLRLPREPEKLIDRVQKFWTAITSNQRFAALEFVLPEKRNQFLSGTPMPILKARVLGLRSEERRVGKECRVVLWGGQDERKVG